MFKRIKLRSKILIPIIFITCVFFVIAIGFVAVRARDMSINSAKERAEDMAYRYAGEFRDSIDMAGDMARSMASTFETLKMNGIPQRDDLNAIMKKLLQDNPEFLQVWSIWEPDALDGEDAKHRDTYAHDGTGRFYPSWYRSGDEIKVDTCESCETPGTGDYYLVPKRNGVETILEPYSFTSNGETFMATDVVVPIKIDGKFLGVVGVGVSLEALQKKIENIRPFKLGNAALISNGGYYAAFTDPAFLGKKMSFSDALESIKSGSVFSMTNHSLSLDDDVYRVFVPVHMGRTETPWSFEVLIPMSVVFAEAHRMVLIAAIILIIALITLSIFIMYIVGKVVKPISAISESLVRFARQDFTLDRSKTWLSKYRDHDDEIGDMYRSVLELRVSLSDVLSQIQSTMNATKNIAESLAALSEEGSAAMGEIADSVKEVSDLSESNSAALEESNASTEEIASGAQRVAQSTVDGAGAGKKMKEKAIESEDYVNRSIEDIGLIGSKSSENEANLVKLNQSVSDISKFVEIITSIADQTNLLALNAAIEAARAGDAGRGFAVVADEVRKLAEESSKAAMEVGSLINTLQSNASEAMNITHEVGDLMEETTGQAQLTRKRLEEMMVEVHTVEEITHSIAAVSQEQAASSEELAGAIEQVAGQTVKVVEKMTNVHSFVEEASLSAEKVAVEAQEMLLNAEKVHSLIEKFRLEEQDANAQKSLKK